MCADLEAEGYEVQPYVLPACAVNAPHRRDRVWFVANDTDQNTNRKHNGLGRKDMGRLAESQQEAILFSKNNKRFELTAVPSSQKDVAHTNRKRPQRGKDGYKSKEFKKSIDEQSKRLRFFPRQDWQEFPAQPPVCGGDDGLPAQLDGITVPKWIKNSIMAMGNAIVPQVAHEIFKAIQAYDDK